MRKFYLLAGILILVAIVFALKPNKNIEALNDTEASKNIETLSDDKVTDNTVHTVTLQQIEPSRVGDEYSWKIESEQGQLGFSLNALGLSNQDPVKINEQLGEDETTVVYQQDDLDLEQICKKFDLDYKSILSERMSITINYSQKDVSE